jgi:hypothetical protein
MILDPTFNDTHTMILNPTFNGTHTMILDPTFNGTHTMILDPTFNGTHTMILDPTFNGNHTMILDPTFNDNHFAGLPTVVAKRMMQMRGESVLVGRIVTSSDAAVAAAADGASLVLVSVSL